MSVTHQVMLMSNIGIWSLGTAPGSSGLPSSAAPYFASNLPSNGGAVYSLVGSWPSGVTIDPTTGVISGTGAAGTYNNLQFALTLPNGQVVYSPSFTIVVAALPTFVVVGSSTPFANYSSDSVSWSSATGASAVNSGTGGLAYGAGVWISSNTGTLYRSADGISWVTAFSAGGPNMYVIWDGARFFALTGYTGGTQYAVTSPDGITWTKTATNLAQYFLRIAYNGSIYAIIHYASTGSSAQAVSYSSDGLTWTNGTITPGNTSTILIYAFGQFINFNYNSTGTVYTSSNNFVTWQTRTIPSTDYYLSAAVGAGKVAAIGLLGRVIYSTDGINWNFGAVLPSGNWTSLTYNTALSLWVAVSTTTNFCATSPDLITWTARTMPNIGASFVWSKDQVAS